MTHTLRRPSPVAAPATISKALLATVVVVTAIAPLATDMYVPAFPEVGAALRASASQVQLTLTTFFVGMALGQLLGGPLSDARGRRRPLVAALVVLTVASVACALVPDTTTLMIARFVQGFSGGVAMVVARSVVVDLSTGDQLVSRLNVVAGISGIAPVLGPLAGALILLLSGWRVAFWVVAALGVAMVVAVLLAVPESLPVARRRSGGLRDLTSVARVVVGHRSFVGYLVVFAASMGVIFAYVSTSAFVLQSMNGLTPVQYSLVFAGNAVGAMLATFVAARLAGRVSTHRLVQIGVLVTSVAGVVLLGGALTGMPLPLALAGFLLLMVAQGLVGPNAGALASLQVPRDAGTGSAVLGFAQWCVAGAVAPLAGLGGEDTAVPMAAIVITLAVLSAVSLIALTTDRHTPLERNSA